MEKHFTCSVDNLRAGRFHTLVTSSFSHNDIGSLFTTLNSVFSCGLPLAQMSGSKAFGKLLLASSATSMLALVGSDWYRSRKAQKTSKSEWWKPPVDPFNDTRLLQMFLFASPYVCSPCCLCVQEQLGRNNSSNCRISKLLDSVGVVLEQAC